MYCFYNKVDIIQKAFDDLKIRLNELDYRNPEWYSTQTEMKIKLAELKEARANVASIIYNNVNSQGKMGILTDDQTLYVDLHGLRPKEAKCLLEELVIPIIPAVPQIHVITGKGEHNTRREKRVLQNELIAHSKLFKIKCQVSPGNKGVLIMSSS